MQAFNPGLPSPGGAPKVRNPLMTLLVPYGVIFGGQILGSILGAIEPALALVGSLVVLGGSILLLVYFFSMLGELKNVTQNQDFHPWFVLIPCLNYYFLWIKVPEEVTKAKQMVRSSMPTRSILLYIFIAPYALAADLNDIAQPR